MTLDDLTEMRRARKDALDLPRTMTQREMDAYLAETSDIDARLNAYRAAAGTLADVTPRLVAKLSFLKFLKQARATLCNELLSIKSPIRDRAIQERAADLDFSIRLIDVGTGASTLGPIVSLGHTRIGQLMKADGYVTEGPELHGPRGWDECIPELERQIAELSKQQAAATAVVEEMRLTDAERTARDDQRANVRQALNTMQICRNSDGTGLVALTLGGDPLPDADMTEAQRRAFARFSAAS